MVMKSLSGPFVLLTILGACSGGGGDDGIDADMVGSLTSRAAVADPVDPGDLPDEATMSGYFAMSVDNAVVEGPVLGDMDVTADFVTGDISGTASNLAAYESVGDCGPGASSCQLNMLQPLVGELAYTGTITGAEFDGNITGALTGDYQNGDTTSQFSADVDLIVDGDFRSDDEGLLGVATAAGIATITAPLDGFGLVNEVAALGGFVVAD